MSNTVPNSRNGECSVRRIMTADVAQAVAGLRLVLTHIDKLDDMVRLARSESAKDEARTERTKAKQQLTKMRAELDAILLGPED